MPKLTTLAERKQQAKQITTALDAVSVRPFSIHDLAVASGFSRMTIYRHHPKLIQMAKDHPNYKKNWRNYQLPKILSKEEKKLLAFAKEYWEIQEPFTLPEICEDARVDYQAFLKNPDYAQTKKRLMDVAASIRGVRRAWRAIGYG